MMDRKSLSLCWIFNAPYDIIGGAGRRFRSEVEHFTHASCQTSLICRGITPTSLPPILTSKLIIPTILLPFLIIEVLVRAIVSISNHHRTIFVAHDPISGLSAALASRVFTGRSRTFLVVHGPMSLEQKWLAQSLFRKFIATAVLYPIEILAYHLSDRLIAVSEYEVRYLDERFGIKKKVRMIRNGIQVEKFAITSDGSLRKELDILPNDIMITNVGHLYSYRGLGSLFEAISDLLKGGIDDTIRLIIVGKGSSLNYSMYKQQIGELGLLESVLFLGNRNDIPEILAASDIYAERFSKQVNGIGIAIMEAMAAGLPVITGRDWITSVLLKDGQDCVLVEKENNVAIAKAVQRLVTNPSFSENIGRNARKTAQDLFSVEIMVSNCEKEYISNAFEK